MTPATLKALKKIDPKLGELIERVGMITLEVRHRQSPFEALVQSVIYQQLHGKAAAAILGRVKALYPGRRFPRPVDLLGTPEERLRAAGLSRAKLAAVRDVAAKAIDGTVPNLRAIRSMDDAEIIERLTSIRGVGQWTVEMLLIFKLGRTDILPVTDYGVRKGFAVTYGLADLPTPRDLARLGERWKPHRTTAAWYMWRAADLAKNWKPAGRPVKPARVAKGAEKVKRAEGKAPGKSRRSERPQAKRPGTLKASG